MLPRRFLTATPIRLLYHFIIYLFLLPLPVLGSPTADLFPYRSDPDSECVYFDANGDERIRLDCSSAPVTNNSSATTLPDFIKASMGEFSEGLAPVRFPDEKWRYIDKNGKIAISTTFDEADRFSEGLARVRKNGKYGYVDRSGRMVIPPRFARSGRFVQGLAYFQCNTGLYNYGYMDRNGKQVLPCKYQEASDFTEDGLARARMWDLFGFIDRRGRVVLDFGYKLAGHFHGGMAYVLTDKGFAFINRRSKRLITIQHFDLIGDFGNGLAPVRKTENLRWGYIDRSGKTVIPPLFFEAFSFNNGLAIVQGPRSYTGPESVTVPDRPLPPGRLSWYYIDKRGRRLFPR